MQHLPCFFPNQKDLTPSTSGAHLSNLHTEVINTRSYLITTALRDLISIYFISMQKTLLDIYI